MSNLGEPVTLAELKNESKSLGLDHLFVFFDADDSQTYTKDLSALKDFLEGNLTVDLGNVTGDSVFNTSVTINDILNIGAPGDITFTDSGQTLQQIITGIEGDVSNNTSAISDLDAAVVKLTGDQTISGVKTFSNGIIVPNPEDIDFSGDGSNLQQKLDSLQTNIDNIDLSDYLSKSIGGTMAGNVQFDAGLNVDNLSNIYVNNYNGVGSDLDSIFAEYLKLSDGGQVDGIIDLAAIGNLYMDGTSQIYFSQLNGGTTLDTLLGNFLDTTIGGTVDGDLYMGNNIYFYAHSPSYLYFNNDVNGGSGSLSDLLANFLDVTADGNLTGDLYLNSNPNYLYMASPSYIVFDDSESLEEKLNASGVDWSNVTDATVFNNTVEFNANATFTTPAGFLFDNGDDLQDVIDASISAIDYSNYMTLDSIQSVSAKKVFNSYVDFYGNARFYYSPNFYKRVNIQVNDSSLQSLHGSLFKTSDGHNGYPTFTEDYGQIEDNDPTSPYPTGEKTAYIGARHAAYIYDKDFLEASNISGDQLDALNHSFIRSLTIPFYNVYSIPHSLVLLDFTGNISDVGNQIELFGVTFSLTETGNSISQLVTDLNDEFDTYEVGGANDNHANATSIAKLRAVSYTDTGGTYADPGDVLLYIISDAPEKIFASARSEFNLVGVNDVTTFAAWEFQARKPQFQGGGHLIDSIDHIHGTYQIRQISQGGNTRDLDSISFLVDREGNVGVGTNTHPIAEFDPDYDQKLGMLKTLLAKFEVRGFGYGNDEVEGYKPALKVSKGDSDLELDSNRTLYGRTYNHDDFKKHSSVSTRVFSSDFARISTHTDHNTIFYLDWSHHNQIIELHPVDGETITIALSGVITDWSQFSCKIINLQNGTTGKVKLNFYINEQEAWESDNKFDNIEIYSVNNNWRALYNLGFEATTQDPVDTLYGRTYSILQGDSDFTGSETEAAVVISNNHMDTENVEIDINISGALITKTVNASAEDYVDSLYTIWREGFNSASNDSSHYYGGAYINGGQFAGNRGSDYKYFHGGDVLLSDGTEALLGWYQDAGGGSDALFGRMQGTIGEPSNFCKYVHGNNALEKITTPAHYVLPAIKFNSNIGWIPILLLPYLNQGTSPVFDLGNFQTPYMGGDETTLATARDALTVNPSKDPADTEYDLRYHELIWNLYQKNSGNSYDDEVIANAHPYSFTINLQNIEDAFGIVDKSGRLTTVEFALITAASASVGGGLVEHSPVPIDNSDADFVTGSIINISGAYDIDMHLRFI